MYMEKIQESSDFEELREVLEGDLFTDNVHLTIYSTDASAYRERPLAVTRPKNESDIQRIIQFACKNNLTVIPRAAGTSLAGQVVGKGIVADISRHMTRILELNKEEKWVRIQPGIVLDELNKYLEPHGLFFGPETSTANRCMLGGMVGNNACGAHSLIYGSTRDHLLAVRAVLSDGSVVEFSDLSKDEFDQKCKSSGLEGKLYNQIHSILSDQTNKDNIKKEYPDPRLKRRNTGYAIDLLLNTAPFSDTEAPFNFSKLIAGSEGTLAFLSEIKLNLVDLPPKNKGLLCAHFNSLEEAMKANLIALSYKPGAIELIDDIILSCNKENIEQRKNRFFIKGDPAAILVVEFARESQQEIEEIVKQLEGELQNAGLGYHYPLVTGKDIGRVWALRKAGLGLLSNIPGDAKPVSVIEDTSVHPEVLQDYIAEFKEMLSEYNLECVYHAHIATGELHLRPVLNLKDPKDVELFRTVARKTALLVKKHKGSLSGEHGDGRLRGEFIPLMVGEQNYKLLKKIKETWDVDNVFNKGKIVDTPPMNSQLRYEPGADTPTFKTYFRYPESDGLMRMTEKCNGSGDCRKTEIIGGTMCPSFQATRDENTTTRARANVLREYLTHSKKKNRFDHKEIKEVLDLCLSCKGCKSECPSNVDMAKLKAEFLQHYYDANGVPLRSFMIANISKFNQMGTALPSVYNFFMKNKAFSNVLKGSLGFAKKRSIPLLHKETLKHWARNNMKILHATLPENPREVYLFNDEFTNYNDVEIGIKVIQLLTILGYKVHVTNHEESGRTYMSKGFLRKSRKIAEKNIHHFYGKVTDEKPLVGIEPSAILAFRDEYPDLALGDYHKKAQFLASNSFLLEEFLANELEKGNIDARLFTSERKEILLHGHCQQKAVASTASTIKVLSIPENYIVKEIKSGCCGMAGSFGYEKEHYDISMKVGELVLFPEVRKAKDKTISAPGTSCRHQISDGTGTRALHPAEVLFDALK